MSAKDFNYELWIGTPNEMGDGPVSQGSLTEMLRAVRQRIDADRQLADKYDRMAATHLASLGPMGRLVVGPMAQGETKRWDYRLLGVTVVIEVRRTG